MTLANFAYNIALPTTRKEDYMLHAKNKNTALAIVISNEDNYPIASMYAEPSPETQAQANLLAAAPELLDALKAFSNLYESDDNLHLYSPEREIVKQARDAIKKAEGK